MLRVLLLAALPLLCAGGCDEKAKAPAPLTVLAAASLADAFGDAGRAFEAAHAGTKVEFSFGGSNQLRTQLENGGPGDVFASADRRQMEAAVASNAVDAGTVRVFAHNRLALIVPKENRAKIAALSDLARPGLKIVVADRAVPAGNYTRLMLEKAGESPELGAAFVKAFEANVVSREENVAAVVAKVALNEADAGIAYASDAGGSNGAKLTVIPLPPALEQRAEYVAGVTARAKDPGLAGRFVEFLASERATSIFRERGFMGPGSP